MSTTRFNQGPDVLVAMVTSNRARIQKPGVGDIPLGDWQAAGLLAPSVLRAGRLWTAEQRLLRRQLGALSLADLDAVDAALRTSGPQAVENGGRQWFVAVNANRH